MNLEQVLSEMISEKDYMSLWETDQTPPFQSFFKILVDRVSKVIPRELSDLNVKIGSSEQDRISVSGDFNTPDSKMRIWGQIVWLPKADKFRGKLGASKIELPVEPIKDTSTYFTLAYDTNKNLNEYGTSIVLKPEELSKKFGAPPEGDNFKVSGMYIFEGNHGAVFRVHDYEATSLYWDRRKYPGFPSKSEFWSSKEDYEFRVVGSHDASTFIRWLKRELKC